VLRLSAARLDRSQRAASNACCVKSLRRRKGSKLQRDLGPHEAVLLQPDLVPIYQQAKVLVTKMLFFCKSDGCETSVIHAKSDAECGEPDRSPPKLSRHSELRPHLCPATAAAVNITMDSAYDHIQEENYRQDPNKEPSAGSSTQNETANNLNAEIQDAYKAISSSPWAARLGGFFGSVKKQVRTHRSPYY